MRIVWSFVMASAMTVAAVLAVGLLAFLAKILSPHPECATIPEDVGPCGLWGRISFLGPVMMTIAVCLAALAASMLAVVGAGIAALARKRHPTSP
ncbi:hypothetical protein [Nocardia brasiliensis]|uniref:Integral membrane protein n=1 Tax=Nocardia brasiliensis (strain ATCC 700358 / HUJEG-1) TaxID=1133849 RepID=K0EU87_NOCB7|nr:hypothetical protein [Nocardia brasiliensis]AFU03298.1 hypothetical protein O3I_026745 [Nocardia brasiliensis ATCC 700358]OCF86845.1 hypothetical protein AW168_28250 [Nocardia brasiliensis]